MSNVFLETGFLYPVIAVNVESIISSTVQCKDKAPDLVNNNTTVPHAYSECQKDIMPLSKRHNTLKATASNIPSPSLSSRTQYHSSKRKHQSCKRRKHQVCRRERRPDRLLQTSRQLLSSETWILLQTPPLRARPKPRINHNPGTACAFPKTVQSSIPTTLDSDLQHFPLLWLFGQIPMQSSPRTFAILTPSLRL